MSRVISRFESALPRRLLLAGVCVMALAGCAGRLTPEVQRLPERVELNGVAFFRGVAYQSGPVALATMLSQQGVAITPGLLEKPLKLPGGEAQLEQNMQTLTREYGLMVYPLDPELPALLTQVAAGYPVMVRFTEGSTFWAEPRYAILGGYNRKKQTVLLRSGMDRHLEMSFSSFTSAWKGAGSWAILVLSPRQLPAKVDQQRWLKAANDLAQSGQERAAATATQTLQSR